MFRVLCAFLLVGCGNKDDAYTPDTSLGMGDQGCYVTPSIDGEVVRGVPEGGRGLDVHGRVEEVLPGGVRGEERVQVEAHVALRRHRRRGPRQS